MSYSPMLWIILPFAVLAGLCWLSLVIHFVASLLHLNGRRSLGSMLFNGFQAYNADNFTPRGQVFQKRFVYSALGFALSIAICIIVAMVASLLNR